MFTVKRGHSHASFWAGFAELLLLDLIQAVFKREPVESLATRPPNMLPQNVCFIIIKKCLPAPWEELRGPVVAVKKKKKSRFQGKHMCGCSLFPRLLFLRVHKAARIMRTSTIWLVQFITPLLHIPPHLGPNVTQIMGFVCLPTPCPRWKAQKRSVFRIYGLLFTFLSFSKLRPHVAFVTPAYV